MCVWLHTLTRERAQVRNLTSSMKVAVDFLSPHNMGLCLHMAREIRGDTPHADADLDSWYESARYFDVQEKLQSEVILVHSAVALLGRLGSSDRAHARSAGGIARAHCACAGVGV